MTITFCLACDRINKKVKGFFNHIKERHYMRDKIKLSIFTAIISIGLALGVNAATETAKPAVSPPVATQKTINRPTVNYELVNSLDVVANPAKYLNKHIKIRATFDKFSTLGLDYKPAFRSSDKYISFLIKREDVTNHTIPLSEMKNFLAREEAEKYIDLTSGDKIEYTGIVFSNALGDVWISVDGFTVLSQQNKSKDKKEQKNR